MGSKEIEFKDLENEAIEINRRYNNWDMFRRQHRRHVLSIIQSEDDEKKRIRLIKILSITNLHGGNYA